MVMYALAAMLLPVVLANSIGMQQWGNSGWGKSGWDNSGWGKSGWDNDKDDDNSGWGMQMQGQMRPMQNQMMGQMGMQQMGQQMQQGNNQWWGIDDEEDYEAYMKWCEERRLAIQEQEAQKKLLEEIEERAEEKKKEAEREAVMKHMRMKRESLMNQWKMWQAQLKMSEEFDGGMEEYTEMKVYYMWKLTMDLLKFCRCNDETALLQKYLAHGTETYMPDMTDSYSLEDLEGIDINNVEAVSQRLATLPEAAGIKLYFGGVIDSMCTGVKGYIAEVKQWEQQYNFMGM